MPEDRRIRPLDRANDREVELVAARMRLTLVEVLGPEVGGDLYSPAWLIERVRFHLDPTQCQGEVFLAEDEEGIRGHTIVRVEDEEEGRIGLFSTVYVEPAARGRGLASGLLREGEAWLEARGLNVLATNTSETNDKLVALFGKHGYAITLRVTEKRMIRLAKTLRPTG